MKNRVLTALLTIAFLAPLVYGGSWTENFILETSPKTAGELSIILMDVRENSSTGTGYIADMYLVCSNGTVNTASKDIGQCVDLECDNVTYEVCVTDMGFYQMSQSHYVNLNIEYGTNTQSFKVDNTDAIGIAEHLKLTLKKVTEGNASSSALFSARFDGNIEEHELNVDGQFTISSYTVTLNSVSYLESNGKSTADIDIVKDGTITINVKLCDEFTLEPQDTAEIEGEGLTVKLISVEQSYGGGAPGQATIKINDQQFELAVGQIMDYSHNNNIYSITLHEVTLDEGKMAGFATFSIIKTIQPSFDQEFTLQYCRVPKAVIGDLNIELFGIYKSYATGGQSSAEMSINGVNHTVYAGDTIEEGDYTVEAISIDFGSDMPTITLEATESQEDPWDITAELCEQFKIDVDQTAVITGENLEIMLVSAGPGGGTPTATIEINGNEETIEIGETFEYHKISKVYNIKLIDIGYYESSQTHYAVFTVIKTLKPGLDQQFTLTTCKTPKAAVGSLLIELLSATESYQTGVPAVAVLNVNGQNLSVTPGTTEEIEGYTIYINDITMGDDEGEVTLEVTQETGPGDITAELCEMFQLETGQTATIQGEGINIKLISAEQSYASGIPGQATIKVNGQETELTVGNTYDYPHNNNIYEIMLYNVSYDETQQKGQAYFSVTKTIKPNLDENFTLTPCKTPKAIIEDLEIELISVAQSYATGVPGQAILKINNDNYYFNVGGSVQVEGLLVSLLSVSSGDEGSATLVVTQPTPETILVLLGEQFKLETGQNAVITDLNNATVKVNALHGGYIPGESWIAKLTVQYGIEKSVILAVGQKVVIKDLELTLESIESPEANKAKAVFIAKKLEQETNASETPGDELAELSNIETSTSQVTRKQVQGTKVTYTIEGETGIQGYLRIKNAPRKPSSVKFDGNPLEECSISLLQTCISNLVQEGTVDVPALCSCWTYNQEKEQIDIFYLHSEHEVEIDFSGEPIAQPEPTENKTEPEKLPDPQPPEETDNTLLYAGLFVVFIVVILLAIVVLFLLKKKPKKTQEKEEDEQPEEREEQE